MNSINTKNQTITAVPIDTSNGPRKSANPYRLPKSCHTCLLFHPHNKSRTLNPTDHRLSREVFRISKNSSPSVRLEVSLLLFLSFSHYADSTTHTSKSHSTSYSLTSLLILFPNFRLSFSSFPFPSAFPTTISRLQEQHSSSLHNAAFTW